MSDTTEPRTRDELLVAFDTVHAQASGLFGSIAPDDFFRRPEPEVWSPGENQSSGSSRTWTSVRRPKACPSRSQIEANSA